VKRAGLLALLVLALAPGGAGAVKQRTSMQAVLPQVMCVTCGIPLSNAESAQADDEKAFIQQLIDRGDTLSQIKRALVAQYGNAVLALPPAQGFDLTVYVVPVVVVLGLLAALVVLLPRWRRNRPPPGASGTAGPTTLSKEDAARLDADLARYD
jgi:cytochrome c-type biogenesis protein CcmH/NrfF